MMDTSADLPNFVPMSMLGVAETVGSSWGEADDPPAAAADTPPALSPLQHRPAIVLSLHPPLPADHCHDFYFGGERVVLLSLLPGGASLVAAPSRSDPTGECSWSLLSVNSADLFPVLDDGLQLVYTPEPLPTRWLSRNIA